MIVVPQKVDYVDHMGTDLSVVNAARVSFSKTSDWEVKAGFRKQDLGILSDKDCKLIKYLANHGHWTPFGHTSISLRIKCPIFVARQLGKHQVGLVWNEVSRRYVDEEPEFFWPDHWRGAAANVKQGSSNVVVEMEDTKLKRSVNTLLVMYLHMIDLGVAPEQARMVLPQNMMTEFIWTGSLAAFTRVCKLRLDPHTQKETQDVARQISTILESLYPHSYQALMGVTND